MLGYQPIALSDNEFTTHWKSIATDEEQRSFLKEHPGVMTDAGKLNLAEQSYCEESIGETAYNSYTNVLYVFPDHVCEQLLPVIRNRYITTTETISYENARELERIFSEEYPETADTGVSYSIRLSTLQINSTKANNFYDLVPAAAFGRRPVSLSLFRTPETGCRRTTDRKTDPETIRCLVWTSDYRGSDRLHGRHCLFCSDHIRGDFGIYRIWYIDAAVRHNGGNSGAAVDLLFSMHMDTLPAFCCPIILCL